LLVKSILLHWGEKENQEAENECTTKILEEEKTKQKE
jgi:hypothetical protein